MKNKILKKLCSVLVTAMLLFGAGALWNVPFPDMSLTVNAEDLKNGDYMYRVISDKEVCITRYNGSNAQLTIPGMIDNKTVTSIDEHAFKDRTTITSVYIPDSVTSIGYCAFENCTGLNYVLISNKVKSIGGYAFYRCISLKKFTIPYSVTKINESTFSYCYGLTSITIPDSVKTIGDHAFDGCNSLTSITIPDSVTKIGSNAFCGCSGITSITIPDSVRSIGDFAFSDCSALTSVTLPESLPEMGGLVFDNTPFIKNDPREFVILGDGFLYQYKGSSSVYDSPTFVIPDGVKVIGADSCHSLMPKQVIIPDSVTVIGRQAFFNCRFTSVNLGSCVERIEDQAFDYCLDLKTVTMYDSVRHIGYNPFCNAPLTEIIYYGTEESYSKIDVEPLYREAYIDPYVRIEDKPVFVSGDFEYILVPGGGVEVVKYNGNKSTIAIPDTMDNREVWNIADGLFKNDTELTSVELPKKLRSIGKEAFYGCPRLKIVKIPDSIVNVGENAFTGTHFLSNDKRDWLIYGKYLDKYVGRETDPVIPDTVQVIGVRAFTGRNDIYSVTFCYGIEGFNFDSFAKCMNLKTLTFYDSVKYIDATYEDPVHEVSYPLDFCDNLTLINFYGTEKSFKSIRVESRSLKNIIYAIVQYKDPVVFEDYKAEDGKFEGKPLPDDTLEIVKYTGDDSELIIPDRINDKKVTSIRSGLFRSNESLTLVTIPEGITDIGEEAFSKCSNLIEVSIPDSVKNIGEYAFSDCISLNYVNFGTGLEQIGFGAFHNCTDLASVTIPEGITDIGEEAFSKCRNLIEVSIPDSVKNIGEYAFSDCISLNYVNFGSGLEQIGFGAFYNCTNLVSVTMYDSVTSIGDYPFFPYSSLKELIYYGTEESFNAITMDNTTRNELSKVIKYEEKPDLQPRPTHRPPSSSSLPDDDTKPDPRNESVPSDDTPSDPVSEQESSSPLPTTNPDRPVNTSDSSNILVLLTVLVGSLAAALIAGKAIETVSKKHKTRP